MATPSDNVGPVGPGFESSDDFLSDFLDDVQASADTPVNEETGEKEVKFDAPESVQAASASAPAPMDDAKRRKVTERLMKLRDMGQSRIMAAIVGDINRYKEFLFEPWEFELMCDVYEDIIAKTGAPHPFVQVALFEAAIMGPKIKQVFNVRAKDRQIRELQEQNARLSAQFQQAVATGQPVPAAVMQRERRRDGKLMWKIDANGYFEYDQHGQRIKVGDRREKPDAILDEEFLLRWNEKKYVEAAFNVKYI